MGTFGGLALSEGLYGGRAGWPVDLSCAREFTSTCYSLTMDAAGGGRSAGKSTAADAAWLSRSLSERILSGSFCWLDRQRYIHSIFSMGLWLHGRTVMRTVVVFMATLIFVGLVLFSCINSMLTVGQFEKRCEEVGGALHQTAVDYGVCLDGQGRIMFSGRL